MEGLAIMKARYFLVWHTICIHFFFSFLFFQRVFFFSSRLCVGEKEIQGEKENWQNLLWVKCVLQPKIILLDFMPLLKESSSAF
jgi:hypothetical protein